MITKPDALMIMEIINQPSTILTIFLKTRNSFLTCKQSDNESLPLMYTTATVKM